MSAPARIIVQSDWDQSLRTINGKAWLTVKKTGSPSIYGEIVTTQLSEEGGSPYVRASENFAVPAISKIPRVTAIVSHVTSEAPNVTFSTIHAHGKSVLGLDVTEGGLAVSSDTAGKLFLWQTNNGEIRRELIGHVGDVYTCRFFPSGIVIVSAGADTQLKIWSAETGQCAATIVGHKAGVNEVNIIDRGRNILSCSNDGTVKLWDCGQQKCLGTIEPNTGVLNCLAVQKVYSDVTLGGTRENIDEREIGTAGKMLLTGGEGKLLKAYGLQSRECVFELQCHDAVNCVTFLSDVTAVCGTQSGHIVVIDIRNPSVPLKEYKDTRSAILSVLAHKQGFLASTGDGSCFYMDESYTSPLDLTGPDCDPVYRVVQDRDNIYTACRDGSIRKYKLDS